MRQGQPLGLGHAVGFARSHVGDEPFAVLLGDDLIGEQERLLTRMVDLAERTGRSVVAVMEFGPEELSKYGVIDADPDPDDPDVFVVRDMVEKPGRANAPSNLCIIGRYLLTPDIFDHIAATRPGRGGEIQLTDAMRAQAQEEPIRAIRFTGVRYDVGSKPDYLRATVELAARTRGPRPRVRGVPEEVRSLPAVTAHDHGGQLVPLEEYRRDVLSRIGALEALKLGLLEAQGCVLAEDIVAPTDLPAFANSGMDGFAVRAGDAVPGARLSVAGEIAAGATDLPSPGPGQAVRIMTGAPLPEGADAVIPVELVGEGDGTIEVHAAVDALANVRPAGEDVRAGTVVLESGTRLGPAELGMCAAVGRARVSVHPRPRLVVLSTGDELVEPGKPLVHGQVHDSNSFMLVAQAREAGAVAFRHAVVGDDRPALQRAIEGALAQADVLLTSGGVSAGRYDLSKQVLAQMGDVAFAKVGVQPGMPQAFGFINQPGGGAVPVFGLPGNPVSAFVSFELLVRPAVRRLQGRRDLNRPRVVAILDQDVASPAGRVSFLRVRLHRDGDRWHAATTGPQGSGLLGSVVAADGLAEVPANREEPRRGRRGGRPPARRRLVADPDGRGRPDPPRRARPRPHGRRRRQARHSARSGRHGPPAHDPRDRSSPGRGRPPQRRRAPRRAYRGDHGRQAHAGSHPPLPPDRAGLGRGRRGRRRRGRAGDRDRHGPRRGPHRCGDGGAGGRVDSRPRALRHDQGRRARRRDRAGAAGVQDRGLTR